MKKILSKYYLPASALSLMFLVVTVILQHPSPPVLSSHLYLIYSSDSELQDTDKQKIEKLFSFGSKQNITEALTEGATYINATLAELVNEIRIAQRIKCPANHLVTLDPPYSDNLKLMRQNIESQFDGEDRRNALRSIIPVIHIEEFGEEYTRGMLSDNLVYIQDNYGGLGFIIDDFEMEFFKSYSKLILQNLSRQ